MRPQHYINPHLVITIDGTAGSGKGTLAKNLARHFRVKFLDTGTLYRSVAHLLMEGGHAADDVATAVTLVNTWDFDFRHVGNNQFGTFLSGTDVSAQIRTHEVGRNSSIIAVKPEVRRALFDFQVNFAAEWKAKTGVVLDGRDIGWRICPTAECKFFLDGRPEIRAQRRQQELLSTGKDLNFEEILTRLNERDARDAPNTQPAKDAMKIDTSDMGIDEVFNRVVDTIENFIAQNTVPCGKPTA